MKDLSQITRYFPSWLSAAASALPSGKTEELRLRVGMQPMAFYDGREHPFSARSITASELEAIVLSTAKHSCYAVTDKLSEGYLTVEGGHRIGICGTAVIRDRHIRTLKEISSLCIRISCDCSDLFDLSGISLSRPTLIIGRAGSGKTTLLRACIRKLSSQQQCLAVADSRGEIASMQNGESSFSLGEHVDVLTGVKTAQALMMLLRTMRPSWLCADEITAPEDVAAIELCSYCGAKLLATAHAQSIKDLQKRPLYRTLCALGVFEQVITIHEDRSITAERMKPCCDSSPPD